MATYVITPAVGPVRKEMTKAQRTSSLFSEFPVVLGKILRRGSSLSLGQSEWDLNKAKLDVLVNAGAIKVHVVASADSVKVEGEVLPKEAPSFPEVTASVTEEAPSAEAAPPETSAEVSPADPSASAAQPVEGRKGKKNRG